MKAKHERLHYPSSRTGTLDLGQIGRLKHHVAVLLEIDATAALEQVRRRKSEGEAVSFFAWMVKAISTAIAADRPMQALRGRKRSLVVFEDVDISVMVEKVVQDRRVPLVLVLKKTNEKSVEAIYAEIRAAQRQKIRDESDYVLGEKKLSRFGIKLFYALPQRIRLFLLAWVLRDPFRSQAMMGTALVTSVGAVGGPPGWALPKSMHNLCFAIGSVTKKPWVVEERVEIRDILHLTLLFDHDAVDGGQAARFVAGLVARIEKGEG